MLVRNFSEIYTTRNSRNVYALFGDLENTLRCPFAYQSSTGTNVSGDEFDWLSVGLQSEKPSVTLATIGIDFEQWNNGPLNANNGAVFWMDPDEGPTGEAILAQLILPKTRGPTIYRRFAG